MLLEMKKFFLLFIWCLFFRFLLRLERFELGVFGYKLDGVDGLLEYELFDDVDIDRVDLFRDCVIEGIIIVLLLIGLRGDGGIE